MASIFTKIVQGELPAVKVYEDEETLAFMDINPVSRGHTLVICKEEHVGLLDMPPELAATVAKVTQRVARAIMDGIKPDGFKIWQNNGSAAGQIVFHYHNHIIPSWEGQKIRLRDAQPASTEELEEVAAIIRAHMHS